MSDPSQEALDFLGNIDEQTDPCDDMYQFSCGGWLKDFELPISEVRYVKSFKSIYENNLKKISTIISTTDNEIIKNYYSNCMDLTLIERKGGSPIIPHFVNIETVLLSQEFTTMDEKKEALLQIIGKFHSLGYNHFFYFGAEADRDSPDNNLGMIGQYYSYFLPQVYYKKEDVISKYEDHIFNMFKLIYTSQSHESIRDIAKRIVKIESKLASFALTPVQLRDPYLTWNKMNVFEISELVDMPFDIYFTTIIENMEMEWTLEELKVNVQSKEYLKNLFHYMINNITVEEISYFMKWVVLHQSAEFLSTNFVNENFDFFYSFLYGQKEQKKREKICQEAFEIGGSIGFLVGKYYVEKYFSEDSKRKVTDMLEKIQSTFKIILDRIKWMDASTKITAYAKLNKITNMIGYPDDMGIHYRGISSEIIKKDMHFLENVEFLRNFEKKGEISKIKTKVNKDLWEMTPQTVNAYYEPLRNQMVFPAGILQAPFFSIDYPDSLLYGGLGVVLGHELSHGFDDEGCKFDEKGMLNNWWSKNTKVEWKKKTTCIKNQYGKYSPIDGYFLNGNLTSGENIADTAGVKIAFEAYRKLVGNRANSISKFTKKYTNLQLFFIQFAQIWCFKATDEAIIQRVEQDPHSTPNLRVVGAISNSEFFGDVFSCSERSKMNPYNKCIPY